MKARGVRRAPAPSSAFESDVRRVLDQLRLAVSRVVEATPGGIRRAIDLRRALDLDAALAWQVHKLATASDPFTVARIVPKAGAMDRFFKAALEQRVPRRLVDPARSAYAQFESAVTAHAADRQTFDSMVSAFRPDDGRALERIRRAAFAASSAVWGVSVRCTLNCVIYAKRPTGEHDCLAIRGRVGLAQLHQSAVIGVYASSRTWSGASCPPDSDAKLPLDDCRLLEEYCSRPIPRIERLPVADGTTRDFLQTEGLGAANEVTLFWRNYSRGYMRGEPSPPHGSTTLCLEPAEVLVTDLLVPRGWSDPARASAWMTPESSRSPVGPGSPAPQRLPFEGGAEYLGATLESLHTPHAPQYADIVAAQLKAMPWPALTFDIYRCTVRYPVLHSAVHLCADAPR